MTLVGVSHEKNIALAGVKVRVVHQQNIIDCYGPFDPRQRGLKITKFRRHIEVKGDLSQEDLAALLWGANHCPISNSLKGAIEIDTKIKHVESG